MKNLLTFIGLLLLNFANGQYFQQRFNLDYATPNLRNERDNSGIRTRDNYMAGNPLLHYYVGIGTSYNNTALPAPDNVADRMRFQQLNNTGVGVITNIGYQFADAGAAAWYHSYGNSIAEVLNATNTGGYVTVGTVTNNTITGAAAILGNSDALFTQLDAAGNVISAMRYDINGGQDQAWCIRKSAIIVNGLPTWILCGQSKKTANNTDCFVARVFANGTPVWFNRYNFDPGGAPFNSAHNIAKQLCEDVAGNIYVAGTLQDAGAVNIDGLAFRLTPAGAVVWANNYNIAPDDEFQAIRLSFDGNIVLGGFTNFGVVAPATHNMLITKLLAANGAIMFQNVLRARIGANVYTSRCYDIIESLAGGAVQYFLAGPFIRGAATYEMMYRVGGGGVGISWYRYNRMNYNLGFGLDDVNTAAFAGVAYFSSMRNPATPGFSDTHIMKSDYLGRTCNFCASNAPFDLPLQMQVFQRQWLQVQTGQPRQLIAALYKYNNILICNVPAVACAVATTVTAEEETEAVAATVKPASIALYPNPAVNTVKVQFNALPAGEYQIALTNMSGRTVMQKNNVYTSGSSFTDLDISAITPGIYMLTVRRGTLILQQKLVKQ